MRCLAIAFALLTTPALAGATDWQDVGPGARARLITADVVAPDGSTLVALELDMPANTKTYWRVPGETGIPTSLDFSASTGIGSAEILWPYPVVDTSTGYLDYAYFGPTVLPVRLAVTGDAGTIDLTVTLGICSDICVPAQAKFTLPLNHAKADPGQGLRIDQAIANVPLPAEDDTVIGDVVVDAKGLHVPVVSAEIDPSSLIADLADPGVLFGTPQKSPDNGIVILPLLGGEEQSLVGQPVQISFMTPTGPYVVARTIAAPAESTSAAP